MEGGIIVALVIALALGKKGSVDEDGGLTAKGVDNECDDECDDDNRVLNIWKVITGGAI